MTDELTADQRGLVWFAITSPNEASLCVDVMRLTYHRTEPEIYGRMGTAQVVIRALLSDLDRLTREKQEAERREQRVVVEAIELTVRSCFVQRSSGIPAGSWTIDYAGIAAAARASSLPESAPHA